MKQIIVYLFLTFCCLILNAQEERYYLAKLSEEQLTFRNYALGIIKTNSDSVVVKSEAIFDRLFFSEQSILGRIQINCIDGDNHLKLFNDLWVCMSHDMKLLFAFPANTMDVSESMEPGYYKYTTDCSMEGDVWFNSGVIRDDGNVIIPARDDIYSYLVEGGIIVVEWKKPRRSKTELRKMCLSCYVLDSVELNHRAVFVIPGYLCQYINSHHGDSFLSDEEKVFCEAFSSLESGFDLTAALDDFKCCAQATNNNLGKISRHNIKEMTKLLRRMPSARKNK